MITMNIIASAMYRKGRLTTKQIYANTHALARTYGFKLSPQWKATVRNTMQRHCKANAKYTRPNLFKNHGRGVWECIRDERKGRPK